MTNYNYKAISAMISDENVFGPLQCVRVRVRVRLCNVSSKASVHVSRQLHTVKRSCMGILGTLLCCHIPLFPSTFARLLQHVIPYSSCMRTHMLFHSHISASPLMFAEFGQTQRRSGENAGLSGSWSGANFLVQPILGDVGRGAYCV